MDDITEKDVYGQEPGIDPTKVPEGRPTKYDEKYNKQVYKLCLLGATDKELADFLEIEESTLNNWKHNFPEFMESIKKGKIQADSNVAKSLYKRAIGYKAPDIHFASYEGSVIETPYTKHYPPDPTAIIFWLKNRQPKTWRDRQEIKHDMPGNAINVIIKKAQEGDD